MSAGNPQQGAFDETTLALRAAGGDEAALSTLLEHFSPQLRARLAPKINDAWRSVLEADDVLQVTYLEAFLQIERFAPRGPGSFLAWLTHIAENNLRDAVKGLERAKRPDPRKAVRGPVGDDSYVALVELLGVTNTTPSRNAARGEAHTILDQALAALPPDYEKVIRQMDLQGRGVADVSAELGRTAGAVHMLRARAHDRLKEMLGPGSRFFSQPS